MNSPSCARFCCTKVRQPFYRGIVGSIMTSHAAHNESACRASKHQRVQHLLTADETSLTELEVALTTLPLCSTGRVFVEVASADQISTVDVPPRMIVTWLDRSSRSGAPGTGRACAPGEALARAVAAWAGEMLCTEHAGDTKVTLLGGYLGTAEIYDHLTGVLGLTPEGIHTPDRFGLTSHR